MLRHLINVCVLLMLILQGVSQASAHVAESESPQHCVGHSEDGRDCPCCSDNAMATNGGCAALCAVIAAIPSTSVLLPRIGSDERESFVLRDLTDPSYLPITPPPIS
jgi:hypothetical protein